MAVLNPDLPARLEHFEGAVLKPSVAVLTYEVRWLQSGVVIPKVLVVRSKRTVNYRQHWQREARWHKKFHEGRPWRAGARSSTSSNRAVSSVSSLLASGKPPAMTPRCDRATLSRAPRSLGRSWSHLPSHPLSPSSTDAGAKPTLPVDRPPLLGRTPAARVIATKLENIKLVVKVVRTERVSECHQSHRFLVPTHYLRTVCHAKLVGDFQAPTFVMGGNTPVKQLATRLTYTWNPVAIHSMDRGSYATHRWDASQDQFISAMIHREVYCFAHEGGATFLYVWLKNSEFEFAKNAANRHVLEHWIGNLETHPRELVLPRVNSGCTELSRASRSGSTDSSLGSVGVDISVLESEDFSERHRNITSL